MAAVEDSVRETHLDPIVSDVQSLSSVLGRQKEAPVCQEETLVAQAMSTEDLLPLCFTSPSSETEVGFVSSSSSSEGTRESDGEDCDSKVSTPVQAHRVSHELNAKVSLRKTSRQGRSTQRWVTEDNETIRLVTGCVPLLKDSKILVASASRKPEWILPKGGWELDEDIEESAVRECFEEAGVFGVLGPKLSTFQYETRKAKKRRLEMESVISNHSRHGKNDLSDCEKDREAKSDDSVIATTAVTLSDEAMSRLVGKKSPVNKVDDAGSVASTMSASYSQVRLTLFPLYVTKIMDEWPEKGRVRKAMDIDEAIEAFQGRPELKQALEVVKKRRLHLQAESLAGTPDR